MKKIFILFLLSIAISAFGSAVIRQTKESDKIKCHEIKDLGNRENTLSLLEEKIVKNKREMLFEIDYFHCKKVINSNGEISFSFIKHDPREMISYSKFNKELTYARYFMIYPDSSHEYSDMYYENEKSFIKVVINRDVKFLTLGSGLTSTLYEGEEFITSEFYEYARPTFIDFDN